jgi:hypothetical protein
MIQSWNSSANPEICKASFKASGMFPLSLEKVFENKYVTTEELLLPNINYVNRRKRNFLKTNSRILTSEGFITELKSDYRKRKVQNIIEFHYDVP